MNERISKDAKDRVTWIDVARGILIILVVMGHVKSSYSSSGILENSFVLNYSNVFAYSFHMAAFFFISGLLFAQHRPDKKLTQRIVDKLISYGIPYIIFSFIHYVMQLLLSSASNHTVQFTDILLIVFKPFSFLWFLYVLMLMQIISELLERKPLINLVLSICLFCLNAVLKTALKETGYSELIICDLMNFYMYFVAGIYFGKTIVSYLEEIKHKRCVSIGMSFILAVCALLKMYVTLGVCGDVLLACFGIFTVIIVSQAIEDCKVFRYLGKQSMPIYLLHGYVISFVRIVLTKLDANKLGGYRLLYVQ